MNVNMLTVKDLSYPVALKHLPDPPGALYWAGAAPAEWAGLPKVAIVGSRKCSDYGRAVTEKLAYELAQAGVVIISGLAYGIDITAHLSALRAGGITVAVLPSGVNHIYPAAHQNTARRITERGALISEYPPDSGIAFKSNFIARNRIVSGLADAVLIPEASLKSGSLHTARFAIEQGKLVMAVPGNVTSPASEGCNNLIKSGATVVTDTSDIFFALGIRPINKSPAKTFQGSSLESEVYSLIKDGITDQELILSTVQTDVPALTGALTMLELSGYIRAAGAGNWVTV